MSVEDSLWWTTAGAPPPARPPLAGDEDVDVVIVGAGYTGLWTAYYLLNRDPHLRIAVVEAQRVGFGASGRNGGWCSSLFPPSSAKLVRIAGRDAAVAMRRAMHDAVAEVGRAAEAGQLDIHYAKGGTVQLARNRAQLERAREEIANETRLTGNVEQLELLDERAASQLVNATDVLGATYTPHCAALHPTRLVRGLAALVERQGAVIYEQTPATAVKGGRVITARGTVRAEVAVRATEGYTASLRRQRRRLLPLYSLMIATEPLPESVWGQIGLRRRETFADLRHLRIYGQRTVDERIAFGGRGAPYHFASRVRPAFDRNAKVHEALRGVLTDMFPVLRDYEITHRWGGPLGVPRDWCASVGFDRHAGQAWAGGYVGDGVATANLAGRTLADLITGHESGLTRLPWVNHRSRSWEPEPFRWIGVNAGRELVSSADSVERRTGRPARRAKAMARYLGY